jgi:hypothetical protein
VKDRDLHYDQNMEKILKVSIKYSKLGVLVPSFSQSRDEILKTRMKIEQKRRPN